MFKIKEKAEAKYVDVKDVIWGHYYKIKDNSSRKDIIIGLILDQFRFDDLYDDELAYIDIENGNVHISRYDDFESIQELDVENNFNKEEK